MRNRYFPRTYIIVFSVFGLLNDGLNICKVKNDVYLALSDRNIETVTRRCEGVSIPPTLINMAEHEAHNSQSFSNFSDTMQQIDQSHEVLYAQDHHCPEGATVLQNTQMPENQMPNQCPPRQPVPPIPPPSYIQSLPFTQLTQLNEHAYQQNLSMNSDSATPQWAMTILQTLNTTCARLQGIEREMRAQNTKWANVEYALNTQNSRISNIEEQLHETKEVKQSVSKMQIEMADMGRNISKVRGQMNQYDTSMDHYNEKYENIISDRTRIDNALYDLSCQMKDLQSDYTELQNRQTKTDSKVIDLQCRSMCENLIFSGIKEEVQTNSDGTKYEDSESVLKKFLSQEMDVNMVEFDRVHRLGPIKSSEPNEDEIQSPRPLIAKFERYKDKQYVKMLAPTKLRNKPFGVNEQFPKEVEEIRKTLYGEMKKAKRNPDNKVKLVRDRLYVNGVQINPKSGNDQPFYDERNQTEQTYRKRMYRDSDTTRRSRVFYSRPGAGPGVRQGPRQGPRQEQRKERGPGPNYYIDFPTLPSSSGYKPFTRYDNPRTPATHLQNDRSVHGKKKAVSPLEDEIRSKRQKDLETQSDDEHSDIELSNPTSESQLQHENGQICMPAPPVAQPSHHTNNIPGESIHIENQSGVNQSGVNIHNESDSNI